MRESRSNSRTVVLIATGVLAGIGLVYLIVRYSDRLIELVETFKKRAFLKLEFETPDVESSDPDQNPASEAFYPGYDTQPSPEGTPQPNIPSDE